MGKRHVLGLKSGQEVAELAQNRSQKPWIWVFLNFLVPLSSRLPRFQKGTTADFPTLGSSHNSPCIKVKWCFHIIWKHNFIIRIIRSNNGVVVSLKLSKKSQVLQDAYETNDHLSHWCRCSCFGQVSVIEPGTEWIVINLHQGHKVLYALNAASCSIRKSSLNKTFGVCLSLVYWQADFSYKQHYCKQENPVNVCRWLP